MSFDLKLHAYRLLMDEPFFAALSRKIEKRADYNIPTAGVRVDPESAQFEMIYNPDFFAKLPEEHVRGVLKHELYHLIFEHVTSRKPEGVPHKAWNIAADLAINSHIADDWFRTSTVNDGSVANNQVMRRWHPSPPARTSLCLSRRSSRSPLRTWS